MRYDLLVNPARSRQVENGQRFSSGQPAKIFSCKRVNIGPLGAGRTAWHISFGKLAHFLLQHCRPFFFGTAIDFFEGGPPMQWPWSARMRPQRGHKKWLSSNRIRPTLEALEDRVVP